MHGTTRPAIAVLTPNILMGLGLQTILERIVPAAEVSVFGSFAEFAATDTTHYAHYFTAMQLFARHSAFFRAHPQKTILLGSSRSDRFGEIPRIEIFSGEERLVHDLLRLRSGAPRPDHALPHTATHHAELLTAREAQVLTLIARGLLNKQIADQLHIGITTVISHRRNIMEKLEVKSIAGLIMHAVSMGYADTDEL